MNNAAPVSIPSQCTGKRRTGIRRPLRKVLHLINGDDYSGGERVQDLLGLRLPDFGYAVHYVCLKPGRFDGARTAQEVPLDTFPMKHKFDLRPAMQVARKARQTGCDIIHTHSTRTLLIGRPAAAIARLPIVHHVQSPAIAGSTEVWRNRANAAVTRACLSGLSNIVAVSESLRTYLGRQWVSPQRVEVITNAVPARPVLSDRSRPTSPWTIGICAMFRPRKGLEVLLEALSEAESLREREGGDHGLGFVPRFAKSLRQGYEPFGEALTIARYAVVPRRKGGEERCVGGLCDGCRRIEASESCGCLRPLVK
jgi:glycosyltransferase involved in cell wall biosynthesis